MTVVTNVEKRPDKTPLANRQIAIALVGRGFQGDGSQVLDTKRLLTGADGSVSIDLAPTNTGEYYVWTHADKSQDQFQVPASGGPFTLQSQLVTVAVPAAVVAVTQAALTSQLGSYLATADRAAARPAAPVVVWTGAGANPPNAVNGDFWIHP